MTQSLLETAGVTTSFVVALEGGYDVDTIGMCVEATALALLDEPFEKNPSSASGGQKKDAKPYNLARYWRHSDLLDPSRHSKTMKLALVAIKKSARALAKASRTRRTTGRMYMLPHPAHKRKESVPLCHRPVQQQFDYSAFEAEMDCTSDTLSSDTCIMRAASPVQHRPVRDEQYPFKKRYFCAQTEEGVSVLTCISA